jgi:hypothetical protein
MTKIDEKFLMINLPLCTVIDCVGGGGDAGGGGFRNRRKSRIICYDD